jgi:pyruvate formate-lyase activating enzyme-like uncharacterized protein
MKKTPYHSYKLGNLPKGCQLCVQGAKLVLFITGLCPRSCYFCPISDKKYKKDVTYADEWPVTNIHQIIDEAKLIDAKGAGITGGDPLCKLWNTLFSIRTLKKEFGKKFHIHLYTSLNLINEKNLNSLYKAGLDEIRFHLDLDNDKLWNKIKLALKYDWDIGVEIPVIPKKEKALKKIILFLNNINKKSKNKIKFLNLNELEIADNKVNKLLKLGYKTKNQLSYAVKGSEELALKLLRFIQKNKIKLNIHYCTATLKDKIQVGNRIKRRAKNIKKAYDKVTSYGTLIRGAIYLKNLKPGLNYRKKLNNIKNRNNYIKKLNIIKNNIKRDFNIKNNLIYIDKNKLRILTSIKEIKKIRDKINKNFLRNINQEKKLLQNKDLFLAIVEEYPTYDQLELNVEFL